MNAEQITKWVRASIVALFIVCVLIGLALGFLLNFKSYSKIETISSKDAAKVIDSTSKIELNDKEIEDRGKDELNDKEFDWAGRKRNSFML